MAEAENKAKLFQVLTEIGIIQQLSATRFNRLLPEGLHISHFGVLNHLARASEGQTPVQLADAFQVTRPTMSHTLNVLQKRGLVALRPNPADKRSKLVLLSERGGVLRLKALEALAPEMAALAEALDIEALITILPQLEQLRQYLDSHR